jgi:hypothetical protein
MYPCFDIGGIPVERLLDEWEWLVNGKFGLLAVNAFGGLFLEDTQGTVHRLDVTGGTMSMIASSSEEFTKAASSGKAGKWLLDDLLAQAEQRGLHPHKGQCIGYKIPLVFKESASAADNTYVADLYEYVAFMGDLHGQIRDVADRGQVRMRVEPKPEPTKDQD